MRRVTVNKAELREVVQENRDNHRADFEKAFEGYRRVARERLESALTALSRGEAPPLHFNLAVPEDHTEDYDTVLLMLDMEVGDEVVIEWEEFRNYVRDLWGWSERFYTTSSGYGGPSGPVGATGALGRIGSNR